MKSSVNTSGIQKHVQRENKNYNNKDIDHEKTYLNYDLLHGQEKQNYKELIEKRIEEGYTGERKIRSDAIKHVDGIVTSDNDFFKDMNQDQQKKYFQDSFKFLENEYGKENILYATVHFDEKTPHMHFGVVPLTEDGRLSAKDVIGNKKALTQFQDRYHHFIQEKGFQLERGQSKMMTGAKHEEMDQYKQSTKIYQKHLEETKESTKQTEKELQQKEKKLNEIASSLEPYPPVKYKLEKEKEVKDKIVGKAEITEKETGNVVLTPVQLKTITDKLNAAHSIKKDYERLKSTDLAKENKELKSKYNAVSKDYISSLKRTKKDIEEINSLKKENKQLKSRVKDLSKSLQLMYHTTKSAMKEKFKPFIDIVKEKADKRQVKGIHQVEKQAVQKEKNQSQELSL